MVRQQDEAWPRDEMRTRGEDLGDVAETEVQSGEIVRIGRNDSGCGGGFSGKFPGENLRGFSQ